MTALPDHARDALDAFAGGRPVHDVRPMAGNAGFSYGFELDGRGFVLRVPPPGARAEGPADVLRQARLLEHLATVGVPVPPVRGVGTPDRPWFVVDLVAGASIRPTETVAFSPEATRELALDAVDVLRALHREHPPPWLGAPVSPLAALRRWDRFRERADGVSRQPGIDELRERLERTAPAHAAIGLVHGDYQWGNVLGAAADARHRIVSVIDWELAHAGAVLEDLGWLLLFSDPEIWHGTMPVPAGVPAGGELVARYGDVGDELGWFEAQARYVFSVVIGLNLFLHRTGRRVDEQWEILAPAAGRLVASGLERLAATRA